MTKGEIHNANTLIMNFVGKDFHNKLCYKEFGGIDYSNCVGFYDSSWNWLIPVVEEISKYRGAFPKQTGWVCDCKIIVYKHILYREVVNFIKWYNNQ